MRNCFDWVGQFFKGPIYKETMSSVVYVPIHALGDPNIESVPEYTVITLSSIKSIFYYHVAEFHPELKWLDAKNIILTSCDDHIVVSYDYRSGINLMVESLLNGESSLDDANNELVGFRGCVYLIKVKSNLDTYTIQNADFRDLYLATYHNKSK